MKKVFLSVLFSCVLISFGNSQTKHDSKVGENQFKLLGLTYGFYDNPELLAVVKEVGLKLEEQFQLDYKLQYHLLDIEEPNAFATPGGYVYVTRGLFALINTKDELAGILGHELSHVVLKHGSKKTYGNVLPSILKLPGNIIGLLTTPGIGNIINFPIEFTSEAALSGFSRSMEKNADILGTEVATKAGYYPYALSDFLIRLNDYAEYLVNHEMEKSIFNDHPMTPKRVKKLNKLNSKKGAVRKTTFAGTEIKAINELIYGQNPDGGIIQDSAFLHPKMEFYCEFPPKWLVNNSPESITSISEDKKSAIMISLAEEGNIESSVEKCLEKYKGAKIVLKQKVKVNGLEGYRVNIEIAAFKEAPKLLKILWINLATVDTPLVAQAISNIDDFPEKKIENSFSSFRSSIAKDFEFFEYSKVVLKEPTYEIEKEEKLLEILNDLDKEKSIPEDHYLKSIEQFKLSE